MESELISWLRARLPRHPQLLLGVGDDAAVLRLAQRADCVLTTDMLNDGVDFRVADDDPRRIGRKALAVNLSDLAAMAARPLAALVSLALPRHNSLKLALQLFEGLLPLAEEFGVCIAGGDTNVWDGPLAISITAIGETTDRGPLTRSGASPGEAIIVTGNFGGSILGHQFDFRPRVNEALRIYQRYPLTAGIDVSDGLSLDLAKLCERSGCGALLNLDSIPISAAARQLAERAGDDQSALDHALGDGEDFELILTLPADELPAMLADPALANIPLTCIGRFVSQPGLWTEDSVGTRQPIMPRGWEHRGI